MVSGRTNISSLHEQLPNSNQIHRKRCVISPFPPRLFTAGGKRTHPITAPVISYGDILYRVVGPSPAARAFMAERLHFPCPTEKSPNLKIRPPTHATSSDSSTACPAKKLQLTTAL